jgi:hypothetical protein
MRPSGLIASASIDAWRYRGRRSSPIKQGSAIRDSGKNWEAAVLL